MPSARAAGPEPTFAIRSRYSPGMVMPGTSEFKNSALRCDASGRMPTMIGRPIDLQSSRNRSSVRGIVDRLGHHELGARGLLVLEPAQLALAIVRGGLGASREHERRRLAFLAGRIDAGVEPRGDAQ